jgi:predicted transcriptional regulator
MSGKNEKVKLSLEVSRDVNELLERMAEASSNGSKSDLLRKAIALMEVAVEAKRKGQSLAMVDKEDKLVTKIIGV